MKTNVVMFVLNSRRLGATLASTAASMQRHFADTLEEDAVVRLPMQATMTDMAGIQHPIFIEADSSEYTLFARIGADRKVLLHCERSDSGGFTVVGGEFADDLDSIFS